MIAPRKPLRLMIVAVVALAGCALDSDQSPRDITPAEQPPAQPVGTVEPLATAGSVRMFLVESEATIRLRSVARDVAESPAAIIQALFVGPNDQEIGDQLRSAIPADTRLLGTRTSNGTLTIDVSTEITQLGGDELVAAVGQIVLTAGSLDGVTAVDLLVEGNRQQWPRASGELTAEPLTVYDFVELVVSTQPAFPPIPSPEQTA